VELSLFHSTFRRSLTAPQALLLRGDEYAQAVAQEPARSRLGAMTALPAPSVALDDQLCFALYAASRAVTARYRPMLDALGLTYPQYLVMMLLWESDHQTVGQLGSRLALDSGTLSPLLKRLTAAGMVTRHRRVEDERSVAIALTDEGRALRGKAFDISADMIGAIGFDTGEFDELMQRLRLLTERVNRGEAVC
jgi:DNA-binding MarR family transcriptional regulator